MTENPFFYPGPIRDPVYFYNRQKETKQILERLSKGQSISMIGPRKIGKTSLLFHICRPEVAQQRGLDPARHLIVYFNCEGLESIKLNEFYTLVLEEIARRAAYQGDHLYSPERPISFLEFEGALRKMSEQELKLILLLDEFELLAGNRNLGAELLSGLRALATKFDTAYVTVSRRPLAGFTKDHSHFFNIFFPVKLGLFDEAGSRGLIEGSMSRVEDAFTPEIIKSILELGGGHPFFLQVVGYWALKLQATKQGALESEDLRILAQTVRGQVESHFEYYWEHLAPKEQYVLAALPFTQGEERYREQLEALASLCLIVKENDQYKYFSPLFRYFVRHQKVEDLLQAGPFLLDLSHQRVLAAGKPLHLSGRLFDLLSYLMKRRGQVVSSEELDREVLRTSSEEQNEYDYLSDERLKSAIRELRKALGQEAGCIANKRGVGYMFRLSDEE